MAEVALRLAEALADEVRPRGVTPVDPGIVASSLGVRVEARLMPASVLGATPSDARVVINEALDEPRRRFVLAHELAHVLVKRGRAKFVDARTEERFADAFAEALLVPARALADVVDIVDAAVLLGVAPSMVASRADRLGRRIKPRAA